MLSISTRGRYGTRLLVALALAGGRRPLQLARIARDQNITLKYLEQLTIALRRAGLIVSVRGARGGYLLALPPRRITMLMILNALERRPAAVTRCALSSGSCRRAVRCPTRPVWERLTEKIARELGSITLASIAGPAKPRTPRKKP